MQNAPIFPVTVTDLDDGSEEAFNSEDELACTIEWCDTDDPEEKMRVLDNKGREVRLKIEMLKIVTCELKAEK